MVASSATVSMLKACQQCLPHENMCSTGASQSEATLQLSWPGPAVPAPARAEGGFYGLQLDILQHDCIVGFTKPRTPAH